MGACGPCVGVVFEGHSVSHDTIAHMFSSTMLIGKSFSLSLCSDAVSDGHKFYTLQVAGKSYMPVSSSLSTSQSYQDGELSLAAVHKAMCVSLPGL